MKHIFYFILVSTFISCNNENPDKDSDTSTTKSRNASPCEILSEAQILNILELPSSAKAEIEYKDITYPSCKYTWKNQSFKTDLELPDGRRKTIDYPSELYVILVHNVSDKQYQQSIEFYKDASKVDDIGEKAVYSPQRRQVTFLKNNTLLHINLRVSGDESVNKEKVFELSKLAESQI